MVCVAATLWGACSEPDSFAMWPGSPDDLVLLLSSEPGAQATLVGVHQGQPLLRQEIGAGATLFAVIVPLAFLRSSHSSIDLDPSSLKQTQLVSDGDPMCATEVPAGGDRVYLPVPELESFELISGDGFVPSRVSTATLIAGRALSLPITTEPCRITTAPQPFDIEGSFQPDGDGSTAMVSVQRECRDVVVGLSQSHVYVYERGLPARGLGLRRGEFAEMLPVSAGSYQTDGQRHLVVGFKETGASDAGAIAFVTDDGVQLSLRTMFRTADKIEGIAIDPMGRLAVSGGEDHFWTGTASSTVVDLHIIDSLGALRYTTFGPSGELYIASRSSFIRTEVLGLDDFDKFTLLEAANLPSTSAIRGIAVVNGDIIVATIGKGVFRFAPGQEEARRIGLGVARPESLCVLNRNCRGADYFYSNRTLGHVPTDDGHEWLFFSSNPCSLMAILEVNSGCTTEIGTQGRVVSLSANEHGIVFAMGREVLEIKREQLPNVVVN